MNYSEKTPLFANPMEPYVGLSISDLNRYLPAIQTAADIIKNTNKLQEGLFLTDALTGLSKLPKNSIDLIIADPPEDPWRNIEEKGKSFTLQEFYKWNEDWLKEAHRTLKLSGSIYLMCDWRYSGMFHALITNIFNLQTRITWRKTGQREKSKTWNNQLSDIWFATKTKEFLFNQQSVNTGKPEEINTTTERNSNFWSDIVNIDIKTSLRQADDKPSFLINRILDASSFKQNWVIDPFMRSGGVGVIAKQRGRKFIGFEADQDRLLLAMKRIEQT